MISAKDIFQIDREMIMEMQAKIYQTNLTPDEMDNIFYSLDGITEGEWDELNKMISDREISDLDRIKNGEIVKQSQINAAVFKASKNE